MARPEANFTDWHESPRRKPLVVDDDFSWSDAPSPRRRDQFQVADRRNAVTGTVVIERGETDEGWDRGERVQELEVSSREYPQAVAEDGYTVDAGEADVYTDRMSQYHDGESGRRTVVITGRGSDRMPVRRRPDADLAFYQRASFRPDSVAMWAVLLGIALLLGSIAH